MSSCASHKPYDVPLKDAWHWFQDCLTPQMVQALKNEAYRILQNLFDAEDVLQEAIIKGALFNHQLRAKDRLFPWMFTIVKHEAYACLAKRSMFALLTEMDQALYRQEYWDFERERSINEEHIRLRKAMHELDAISKRIVIMKTTTDMNLHEISRHIGLNYHTVRSKYYRALSAIRKKMMMYYAHDENG